MSPVPQAFPIQNRDGDHATVQHRDPGIHHGFGLRVLAAYPAAAQKHAIEKRFQVQEVLQVLQLEVHSPVRRRRVRAPGRAPVLLHR